MTAAEAAPDAVASRPSSGNAGESVADSTSVLLSAQCFSGMLRAMGRAAAERGADEPLGDPLESVRVGDVVSGTVTETGGPHGLLVRLDGPLAEVSASVGPLDVSWRGRSVKDVPVGRRVTAEVIAVDTERREVHLSMAATENPRLWAFLKGLRRGDVLTGVVAATPPFGVFVALDDGPPHPIYPGVGFITTPELSWRRFEKVTDVVRVGQRIRAAVLCPDTRNGEARLSLRALRPDPFQAFADTARIGRSVPGTVTKIAPFGILVRITDDVEGLLPAGDLPSDRAVQVGDPITVAIAEVDRERRRVRLSRPPTGAA